MAGPEWAIEGTYLEACNCDAICPCRRVGGRSGGRSTHGICLGALSWLIREGQSGDLDLAGLAVVLVLRYSDDEPGSPWTFVLYVDERANEEQRDVLAQIFTGELGGTPLRQFPWAFKPSELRAVVPAAIELDHTPGRGWFSAGDEVLLRVKGPVDEQEAVTCVIPGHHRNGRELYAEVLQADGDDPLAFEFQGTCAYESTFVYSSRDE
jgi:hypothetical protein